MTDFVFTVSEVNGFVKKVLESEDLLQNISIRGEISNLSSSISKHVYFTLKDETAAVQCVWFSGASLAQAINLQKGDKVQVKADVTLYVKGGTYQLLIRSLKKDGTGDLFENFERLKRELEEEGLFDVSNKKPIPDYPRIVGVITSEFGAAIQDITRVLDESWGGVTMRLYPVSVQGDNAAPQMIEALDYFEDNNAADVVIIGRGGGSFEDLNCFNDERLARRIFDFPIPIISAVGHETDFTICDFVCDVREATPSTAASRAVPDRQTETKKVNAYESRILNAISGIIQEDVNIVSGLRSRLMLRSPKNVLLQMQQQIDMGYMKINSSSKRYFENAQSNIDGYKKTLKSLNPKNTLKRGYAIIRDDENNILPNAKRVISAGNLYIEMNDGNVKASVREDKDE